jgi:hypothetical protein
MLTHRSCARGDSCRAGSKVPTSSGAARGWSIHNRRGELARLVRGQLPIEEHLINTVAVNGHERAPSRPAPTDVDTEMLPIGSEWSDVCPDAVRWPPKLASPRKTALPPPSQPSPRP